MTPTEDGLRDVAEGLVKRLESDEPDQIEDWLLGELDVPYEPHVYRHLAPLLRLCRVLASMVPAEAEAAHAMALLERFGPVRRRPVAEAAAISRLRDDLQLLHEEALREKRKVA